MEWDGGNISNEVPSLTLFIPRSIFHATILACPSSPLPASNLDFACWKNWFIFPTALNAICRLTAGTLSGTHSGLYDLNKLRKGNYRSYLCLNIIKHFFKPQEWQHTIHLNIQGNKYTIYIRHIFKECTGYQSASSFPSRCSSIHL